jgi:uncharacterized protein (TIGR03382 family)
VIPLNGNGAVSDEIVAVLHLSLPTTLDFLYENDVRFEFGSDAYFVDVDVIPAPGTAVLGALVTALGLRRRR